MRKIWKPLIAVVAIGLAAFLLYRTLSRYSVDQLIGAVAAIPVGHLSAAAGFAAASYLCLSCFDYLALHYVGRPLPYYKAAWTSFTSLSLGHNIGLAFLSSGAVRYRFYTRWGLSAEQVAKVIAFCGITVGIGLLVLGGVALLLRSSLAVEITGLSQSIVVFLGTACLALPALYLVLAAFVRRPLRIWRWSLEVPSLRLAVGQAAIGSINFACVAACLHQALAAVTDVAYVGVASVYVIANTTALISHVPGGLGVIESVVMYLLPGQDLIGPLLVFRFVYFLIPLCLGIPLFVITELVYRRKNHASSDMAKGAVRA
ncbi:lysylphosphatidylglycerol synthase domain-containing protein [Microvirga pakistanensis]|uniref:lysylphosphatidylglycerol synthase domain-containing protein n=1 Tax=Microvirga pakistanensis TaxID=1682650 RepID=UPI00106BAD4D|nr:lysylphosphatidylglycerol synthase domain-containing protein [Microvirga pakistanensis]